MIWTGDEQPAPGPQMVCRICRQRLNEEQIVRRGELLATHYHHSSRADHAPDPILEGDASPILKCDFCSEAHPAWEFPATTFAAFGIIGAHRTEGGEEVGSSTATSEGSWYACNGCKPLVESRSWKKLLTRSMHRKQVRTLGLPKDMIDELDAVCVRIWGQFDDNRTGPPINHST